MTDHPDIPGFAYAEGGVVAASGFLQKLEIVFGHLVHIMYLQVRPKKIR